MKKKNAAFKAVKTKNSAREDDPQDFEETNHVQEKWFEQVKC